MKRLLASLFAILLPVSGVALMAASTPALAQHPRAQDAPEHRGAPRPYRAARLSRLVGADVETARGRSVGRIADVMVDTANNRLAYLLVDPRDGGPGPVAVPLGFTREGGGRILLDEHVARRLVGAPRFELGRWRDWQAWRLEADRFFGHEGGSAARGLPPRPAAARERFVPEFHRATELLEARIEDWSGRDIGELEDIVVDMSSGRVHYAVAQFDGALLAPERLVAVGMPAGRRETVDSDDLVLIADRWNLRRAPTFERGSWPEVADGALRLEVDRYLAQR